MITVIVTEYKKRGYLLAALRSVFNQTISRDRYEVIVVKNEEEKEVDDYARKHGAKVIISDDRWLGPKITQGLEEAKGDIISLLEDDDMFTNDKLAIVSNIFRKYKINYLHNHAIFIFDNGSSIPQPTRGIIPYSHFVTKDTFDFEKYRYFIGLDSCISIKRDAIDDDIKKMKITVDIFLTFSSLCRTKNEMALIYGESFTYYRVHNDNATRPKTKEELLMIGKWQNEDEQIIYDKFSNCSKQVKKGIEKLLGIKQ